MYISLEMFSKIIPPFLYFMTWYYTSMLYLFYHIILQSLKIQKIKTTWLKWVICLHYCQEIMLHVYTTKLNSKRACSWTKSVIKKKLQKSKIYLLLLCFLTFYSFKKNETKRKNYYFALHIVCHHVMVFEMI